MINSFSAFCIHYAFCGQESDFLSTCFLSSFWKNVLLSDVLPIWHKVAVVSTLCCIVCLPWMFTVYCARHFEGFSHLVLMTVLCCRCFCILWMGLKEVKQSDQCQQAWIWGVLLADFLLRLLLSPLDNMSTGHPGLGRAAVWGVLRPFLPSLTFRAPSSSGLWLLVVSSQMLPRFPFLSIRVKFAPLLSRIWG